MRFGRDGGLDQGEQRFALHLLRDGDTDSLKQSWHYVDQFDTIFDFVSGCGAVRKLDQQWDMNCLIVEKNSVGIFSVGAQRLSVIGHHGDDCGVKQAARFQLPEQLAHCGVFVLDCTVVGSGRVAGLVRLGWIVGIVGVVQMDPNKEWTPRMFADPRQRMGYNSPSSALDGAVAILSGSVVVEAGIVEIKAAVEARSVGRLWLENDGTDECRRVITVLTQNLGTVGEILGERRLHVVYLVELRIGSGQDRGVRGWRKWRLCVCSREDD